MLVSRAQDFAFWASVRGEAGGTTIAILIFFAAGCALQVGKWFKMRQDIVKCVPLRVRKRNLSFVGLCIGVVEDIPQVVIAATLMGADGWTFVGELMVLASSLSIVWKLLSPLLIKGGCL